MPTEPKTPLPASGSASITRGGMPGSTTPGAISLNKPEAG